MTAGLSGFEGAADGLVEAIEGRSESDWEAPASRLSWSRRRTVEHLVDDAPADGSRSPAGATSPTGGAR